MKSESKITELVTHIVIELINFRNEHEDHRAARLVQLKTKIIR